MTDTAFIGTSRDSDGVLRLSSARSVAHTTGPVNMCVSFTHRLRRPAACQPAQRLRAAVVRRPGVCLSIPVVDVALPSALFRGGTAFGWLHAPRLTTPHTHPLLPSPFLHRGPASYARRTRTPCTNTPCPSSIACAGPRLARWRWTVCSVSFAGRTASFLLLVRRAAGSAHHPHDTTILLPTYHSRTGTANSDR